MHRYFCTTDKSNKCNTPGFNSTSALAEAGSLSWENTPVYSVLCVLITQQTG